MGDAVYLLAGVLATCLTLAVAWVCSHLRGASAGAAGHLLYRPPSASTWPSSSVRPLAVSGHGEQGLVLAAMPVALLTALYNVLAVWVLNTTLGIGASVGALLSGIARNPPIIGISAGLDWRCPACRCRRLCSWVRVCPPSSCR